MALENHDRLDKILHTEEYMGMKCGSMGFVFHNGALVPGPDNYPKTEKKYCGVDCPTLKAEIKAEK